MGWFPQLEGLEVEFVKEFRCKQEQGFKHLALASV
jgi:hypothetical protein